MWLGIPVDMWLWLAMVLGGPFLVLLAFAIREYRDNLELRRRLDQ